ncbi:hypothetical protein QE152_g1331 [Popillia japonica]|uniref:Endonuclease/exonuclease/phosphatase domain-containing protein n=1 Tax=Popillia japonica TaxID=7064 RepID=A0AAW1NAX5_POPJA
MACAARIFTPVPFDILAIYKPPQAIATYTDWLNLFSQCNLDSCLIGHGVGSFSHSYSACTKYPNIALRSSWITLEDAMGSDHFPILIQLAQSTSGVDPIPPSLAEVEFRKKKTPNSSKPLVCWWNDKCKKAIDNRKDALDTPTDRIWKKLKAIKGQPSHNQPIPDVILEELLYKLAPYSTELNFRCEPQTNHILCEPFNYEELERALKNNSNTSPGADDIR